MCVPSIKLTSPDNIIRISKIETINWSTGSKEKSQPQNRTEGNGQNVKITANQGCVIGRGGLRKKKWKALAMRVARAILLLLMLSARGPIG